LAGKAEEKRLLLVIRNIFKGQHGVDTLSWNLPATSGRLDGRSVRPFHESSYLQTEHYRCSNASSGFIQRRKYNRGLSSHGGTETNGRAAKCLALLSFPLIAPRHPYLRVCTYLWRTSGSDVFCVECT
jgi:hypothetical protein